MIEFPKSPKTLVLAGSHRQYLDFLKAHNAYPAWSNMKNNQQYYEGGGAFSFPLGMHFSRILVIGTFMQREDAHKILSYSKACLDLKGQIVYDTGTGVQTPMGVLTMDKLEKQQAASPSYMAAQHKEGDIWPLPKANSPMWTTQWSYQGSAKTPYIISHKSEGGATGNTTKDGWACSCMNFTRHTPRTPCKHILNVMIKQGVATGALQSSQKLANVDDAKMKAFEAWQREQAARKAGNKPTAGAKLALFGATTRKFR